MYFENMDENMDVLERDVICIAFLIISDIFWKIRIGGTRMIKMQSSKSYF